MAGAVFFVSSATVRCKCQFGYLKELPPEHTGSLQIVTAENDPDGKYQWEERPGPPPPNHGENEDPNVMRVYLVRAPESGNETVERRIRESRTQHDGRKGNCAFGGPVMKAALLKRLQRLEKCELPNQPLELQYGYHKKLHHRWNEYRPNRPVRGPEMVRNPKTH